MTKEILYKKHKLEDFFYRHEKDDYIHKGFTFKKGEFYEINVDESGVSIIDDNEEWHDICDMDINRLTVY